MSYSRKYQKKSKYGNVRQTYNGYNYDSKKEAQRAMDLDWLIKSGDVKEWDRQVRLSIDVNDKHICDYVIDFRVEWTDGRVTYEEVKGFETRDWRIKWKLAQAKIDEIEPGAKLVLIK